MTWRSWSWAESDGCRDSSHHGGVDSNVRCADAGQEGKSHLDIGLVAAPGLDATNDGGGEFGKNAVTRAIGIILTLGGIQPGVETLGKYGRSGRRLNWSRR